MSYNKQNFVLDVFRKVAGQYDLMNDLMSCGVHRIWRNTLVAKLPFSHKSMRHKLILDAAGGTGDLSMRILGAFPGVSVIICDLNHAMLTQGKTRTQLSQHRKRLSFVEANIESLPFNSDTFDAYTIAFGIRNVSNIAAALHDAYTVLKPSGYFACLEFTPCAHPSVQYIYDIFSFKVIPILGELVVGNSSPYQYLVESIRGFPDPNKFTSMIEEAGFSQVSHSVMSGGIVAIHTGWKT